MKVLEVYIRPLDSKHYATDVEVKIEVDGKQYTLLVSIAGYAPNPSIREKFRGWEPDWGMDHVESEAHYMVAQSIASALAAVSETHKLKGNNNGQ